MTHIEITHEESVLLKELLENKVASMHTEIMHTSSFDYKETLKAKRDSLNRILGSLKEAEFIDSSVQ